MAGLASEIRYANYGFESEVFDDSNEKGGLRACDG